MKKLAALNTLLSSLSASKLPKDISILIPKDANAFLQKEGARLNVLGISLSMTNLSTFSLTQLVYANVLKDVTEEGGTLSYDLNDLFPPVKSADMNKDPHHVVFWKTFDQMLWELRGKDVKDATNLCMSKSYPAWTTYVKSGDVSSVIALQKDVAYKNSADLLLTLQMEIITHFYKKNNQLNTDAIYDSFAKFGARSLSPGGIISKMNSSIMWFYWTAFICVSIHDNVLVDANASNWTQVSRAILCGMLHEAIMGKNVNGGIGFNIVPPPSLLANTNEIIAHCKTFNSQDEIHTEFARLAKASGFF